MNARRAAFIDARVKLSDDAGFVANHIPNQGARISSGREWFEGVVPVVVNGDLDGLDAKVGLKVGLQSGVAPDSEVGGVAVLTDGQTTPTLRIVLARYGKTELRSADSDPKLSVVGKLERGRPTAEYILELSCSILGT